MPHRDHALLMMLVAWLLFLACTTKGGGVGPDTGLRGTGGGQDTGDASLTDADGDGFFALPQGEDCDDSDRDIHPGATETCGDGVDQDCDGAELGCTGSLMATQGGGYLKGGGNVYGLGRDAAVLHGWRPDGGITLALSAPWWWEVDPYDSNGAVFFVHPEDMQGAAVVDTRASGMVFEGGPAQNLGWAIGTGDVDGDGIDDVLMGEPQPSPNQIDSAGGAWLAYGPVFGTSSITDVSGIYLEELRPERAVGGHAKLAINLAGDEQVDVVLGWLQGCWYGQPDKVGGAYIIPRDRIMSRDIDADDIEVLGEAPCIGTLANMVVGDLNGDGFGDLVGSAFYGGKPQAKGSTDKTDELAPGRVYVVLGPITASMNLADADARLDGVQDKSIFGHAMAVTEDQTGDGRADLLVGAKWHDGEAGADAGAAWLISGDELVTDAIVSDVAAVRFSGGEAGMEFGSEVSDGGDQDGDGQREVLVSADSSESNGYRGQVFVFAGPLSGTLSSDDAILEVYGRNEKDQLGAGFFDWGSALLGGADFNADGADDWLVGSDLEIEDFIGAVYTFYGGIWP